MNFKCHSRGHPLLIIPGKVLLCLMTKYHQLQNQFLNQPFIHCHLHLFVGLLAKNKQIPVICQQRKEARPILWQPLRAQHRDQEHFRKSGLEHHRCSPVPWQSHLVYQCHSKKRDQCLLWEVALICQPSHHPRKETWIIAHKKTTLTPCLHRQFITHQSPTLFLVKRKILTSATALVPSLHPLWETTRWLVALCHLVLDVIPVMKTLWR